MRKNFSQMTDEEKKQLFMEMAKKFSGVDWREEKTGEGVFTSYYWKFPARRWKIAFYEMLWFGRMPFLFTEFFW